MLEFASPEWLWGLLALAVPLAIHFLSRGTSPRLALGTIRFLDASPTRTARRVRLTERTLLAVRCLALALVVAILADPVRWRAPAGGTGASGRVYVDPALLEAGRPRPDLADWIGERSTLGWSVELLAPGFPPLDRVGRGATGGEALDGDLWSLAREAVWREAPGVPIQFATSNRDASVSGLRPVFPAEVSWRVWPSAAETRTPNRWLAGVRRPGADGADPDKARVLVATSEDRGTSFAWARAGEVTVATSADGGALRLAADGGSVPDPVVTDDVLEVPLPIPKLRSAVYADEPERELDRSYLTAALQALSDRLPVGVEITQIGSNEEGPSGESEFDLVFWLSGEPVPDSVRENVSVGGVLVEDGRALWEECGGVVEVRGFSFETRRCTPLAASDEPMVPVWELPTGRVLLAVGRSGAHARYVFGSRFRPDWSSLVVSPVLIEWLGAVALEAAPPGAQPNSSVAASDRSVMASEFLVAARGSAPVGRRREADPAPSRILWLLLVGAFVCERWLAESSGGRRE